jgi:hypothetical protein
MGYEQVASLVKFTRVRDEASSDRRYVYILYARQDGRVADAAHRASVAHK